MLEQVGEAGAPGRLVARADLVPDVDRDLRHAVILVEDTSRPFGERVLLERDLRQGMPRAVPTALAAPPGARQECDQRGAAAPCVHAGSLRRTLSAAGSVGDLTIWENSRSDLADVDTHATSTDRRPARRDRRGAGRARARQGLRRVRAAARPVRGQDLPAGLPVRPQRDRSQGDPAGHLPVDLAQARHVQGDSQFGSWLYRVAANTALMRLRAQRAPPGGVDRRAADRLPRQLRPAAARRARTGPSGPTTSCSRTSCAATSSAPSTRCPRSTGRCSCSATSRGCRPRRRRRSSESPCPTVKTRLHRARIALRDTITRYFNKTLSGARAEPPDFRL